MVLITSASFLVTAFKLKATPNDIDKPERS